MIKRDLEKKLLYLAKKFPVLSVTGPRQSGKTTLIRDIFSGHHYLNLEDPDTRAFAQADPRGFLNQHTKLIIDEAQRVPELFSFLQGFADSSKTNGRYILSGSQNFLLQEKISQTLAGRVAIQNLLPFSLKELQANKRLKKEYAYYLFNGFYPRLHASRIKPGDFYPSYIESYVERDVRQISGLQDLRSFRQLLVALAGRTGQVLNYSNLSNQLGLSDKTIKQWIGVLEASFIVFTLSQYHKNFNKRIVKAPKLYFYDTGLVSYLLGIQSEKEIGKHFAKGALFENLVAIEIIKTFWNRGERPRLYYWRDNSGHEIDFILEINQTLKLIEVKASQTIAPDFFKGLEWMQKLSGAKTVDSYLIYGGDENQDRSIAKVRSWKSIPEFEK